MELLQLPSANTAPMFTYIISLYLLPARTAGGGLPILAERKKGGWSQTQRSLFYLSFTENSKYGYWCYEDMEQELEIGEKEEEDFK